MYMFLPNSFTMRLLFQFLHTSFFRTPAYPYGALIPTPPQIWWSPKCHFLVFCMILSEKGSVLGESWYVTSQKIQIFSSHICDCLSVLLQASEQAPGHQIEFIQTQRDANHYMTVRQLS